MDYESLIIGSACFVAVLMVIFAWAEWVKDRGGETPAVPMVGSTPAGNPDGKIDRWIKLRQVMDEGRLNSLEPEDKEIIRAIKNEYPDGWFGKCFPDV